jgi:hypothetical protein
MAMTFPSDQPNKPIFIVGSPRSGTSILTWCLGQHSNIFVQEESNWIGRFAIQVGAAYEVGTARGERSQLSALDVARADFFALFGRTINGLVLDQRDQFERKIHERARTSPLVPVASQANTGFRITRSRSDPKRRWVDGTPEYSFYICALRKLFPHARFIHLARDVQSVVRSILNFDPAGGRRLAQNEQPAYEYWLRAVRACRQAEIAYGSEIVRRIRYSDLIDHSEAALHSLLDFLNEPFEPACLEPLQSRINSSNVSDGFDAADAKTDPVIVSEAEDLNAELQRNPAPIEPSTVEAAAMEAAFNDRVRYASNLETAQVRSAERIAELQREISELQTRVTSKPRDRLGETSRVVRAGGE